jgi:hypothetical protein
MVEHRHGRERSSARSEPDDLDLRVHSAGPQADRLPRPAHIRQGSPVRAAFPIFFRLREAACGLCDGRAWL